MLQPVAQAQTPQQDAGPFAPRPAVAAGIDGGDLDIGDGVQVRQQVIALEDEAEMLAPQGGQLVRVELTGVDAADAIGAGGGPVQAPQDVHQRRLARP